MSSRQQNSEYDAKKVHVVAFLGMLERMYDEIQTELQAGRMRLQKEPQEILNYYINEKIKNKLKHVFEEYFWKHDGEEKPHQVCGITTNDVRSCMEFWELFSIRYCEKISGFSLDWSTRINKYCVQHGIGKLVDDILKNILTHGHDDERGLKRQPATKPTPRSYSTLRFNPSFPPPADFLVWDLDKCLTRLLRLDTKLATLKVEYDTGEITNEDYDYQHRTFTSEKEHLLNRIASEMEERITINEQDLEDANRSNRPMKIAEEYQLMCGNQWLNAKMELDENIPGFDEGMKHELLLEIFMTSFTKSNEALQSKIKREMTTQSEVSPEKKPQDYKTISQTVTCSHGTNPNPADEDKTKKIIAKWRGNWEENLPTICPEDLLSDVYKCLVERFRSRQNQVPGNLGEFISAVNKSAHTKTLLDLAKGCLELTWKMVLQLPKMEFKVEGVGDKWKGDHEQEVAWGSANPKDETNVVTMYVTPGLYHGDQLMVRGKVLCGKNLSK